MKRLERSNADFKFTYTEHLDYGPYLQSVNGVAGNTADHTYWELLVKTPGGKTIRPDVGIGCYIPKPKEQIILKFTKW
ncbi:transcobalamin-1-like [Polymixia lowei]